MGCFINRARVVPSRLRELLSNFYHHSLRAQEEVNSNFNPPYILRWGWGGVWIWAMAAALCPMLLQARLPSRPAAFPGVGGHQLRGGHQEGEEAKLILDSISGKALPRRMLAFMGPRAAARARS